MNSFPLAYRPKTRPTPRANGPLRVYWFSQTIDHDRGIEDSIRAAGLLPPGKIELHLRGSCEPRVRAKLQHLAAECGLLPEALIIHAPERPEAMATLAAEYDVGLALDQPISENRIICMNDLCTNKVFVYLVAGLALAATCSGEARQIFDGAGFAYPHGRAEVLAAGLRRWLENRLALQEAKDIAWRLGKERYNWDVEKNKLLEAVGQTLAGIKA